MSPEQNERSSRTNSERDREQQNGGAEEDAQPSVPSYADDDHTSFLGVDEPVVPEDERGSPPPPKRDSEPPE